MVSSDLQSVKRTALTLSHVEEPLYGLLDQVVASGETHGVQICVESPLLGFKFSAAVGYTGRLHTDSHEPLTCNHPIRIASNTKTFVAAAILRLWEDGRLALDESIEGYIAQEHQQLLQANRYNTEEITIRHLLAHTSGLFDYADSPQFQHTIAANPQHQWTRTEQLRLAMDYGQAYGRAGDVYRYSDTGYILLGEIIERVYGAPLGYALRQLLSYKRINLGSTWLEQEEKPPLGSPSQIHQYDGDKDSLLIDASCDIYGGGGLVSTVEDLSHFMRALFTGDIFTFPETLNEMLQQVSVKRGGPDAYGVYPQVPGVYRLGIEVEPLLKTIYSHKGYLGTYAAYIPEDDLTLCLSVNRHGGDTREMLIQSIYQLFGIEYFKNDLEGSVI